MATKTKSRTVIPPESLKFKVYRKKVKIASLDWFDFRQAKIFKYAKGYEAPLHKLSNKILLIVLKGKVEFCEEGGSPEIAEAGMMRACTNSKPWTSKILEESYILVLEKNNTKMKFM